MARFHYGDDGGGGDDQRSRNAAALRSRHHTTSPAPPRLPSFCAHTRCMSTSQNGQVCYDLMMNRRERRNSQQIEGTEEDTCFCCSFIFFRTASFSNFTSALLSSSRRLIQKSRIFSLSTFSSSVHILKNSKKRKEKKEKKKKEGAKTLLIYIMWIRHSASYHSCALESLRRARESLE